MDTEFKEQVTAAEAIVPNHMTYAQYSIREFLPSYIDGLKLINRRILWTLGSKKDKMKAAKLIADTLASIHPHGPASIYGAMIRLCQSFTQAYPLIQPYGNVGAVGGSAQAAAERYLDIGRSDFAYDIFFARVNVKTFSYVPDEMNVGVEPTYFIPIIPFALMAGAKGIGMGYKTELPMYYFKDICDLTLKYIQYRKTNMKFHPEQYYREFASLLLPAYAQYSLIRNGEELMENYSKGKFNCPIVLDGCMDVYPNKVNLRSIPYGQNYLQILEHLKNEKAKPSFISANVNEVAHLLADTNTGNLKVTLKRDSDIFEILDQLKKELSFTERITPIFNFSDHNGKVYNLTPYMIIEKWYVERFRSVLGDLKITQSDLNKQKREIEAKVIIVDNTDKVTNIIKSSATNEEAVVRLMDAFKKQRLSALQAEYILSLSLSQLTRYGRDNLLKDLEIVNQKIKEHTEKFRDIDQIIMDDIVWVRDKWASAITRKCSTPDYIGCIHINNNGIVQVRTIPELAHQLGRWANENPRIEMYPDGKCYHFKYVDGKGYEEYPLCFPKVFKAHNFLTTKYKAKSTVILNDGLIYRADGIVCPNKGKSSAQYTPVSDEFFSAITNKNVLEVHKTTDAPKRLQSNAMGVKTDITYVSPIVGGSLVVAYYDKKEVNTVHIGVFESGERLTISLISKAEIIGIYRLRDPIAFTVQDKYLNRCVVKHLYFKDGESLLGDEKHITISLNTRRTSNGKSLVQVIKGRELYGVQHLTKVKDSYDFI